MTKIYLLKCPVCGSDNISVAFGHKLNKCLSCHLAFDNDSADPQSPEWRSGYMAAKLKEEVK